VNTLGALLTPSVNRLANRLTGFVHPDDSIQQSDSVYPGQDFCKLKHTAPHAKWHEISANGLMDLAYLSDYVKVVIEGALGRLGQQPSEAAIPIGVVEAWASEVTALPSGDASAASKALVDVVRKIAQDIDACVGQADGQLSAADIVCYVSGISSREDFVSYLFHSISTDLNKDQSGDRMSSESPTVLV